MALVLEVLGGPEAPGGGAFRLCERCLKTVRPRRHRPAAADRRSYRMLAREVLRLRALVPPERRHEQYVARAVVEDGDPALPRNIGEAVEQNRRRREAEG